MMYCLVGFVSNAGIVLDSFPSYIRPSFLRAHRSEGQTEWPPVMGGSISRLRRLVTFQLVAPTCAVHPPWCRVLVPW